MSRTDPRSLLPTPVADAVAAFVAGSSSALFADDVRALARRHLLDTLASVVACRDLEPAVVARRYAVASSGTAAPHGAVILGTTERAALPDAVLASAMAGHGHELNDFVPSVFVQPGPAVVAAALSMAADRGRSGDDVVRAVIVGYELAVRFPRALGVANLRRAGIANHGVGPVFGAAGAAASIAGLPPARIHDVLACCAHQASGSWQWLLDGAHIEKAFVFAGMGARNGLQAVLLAEAGFRGVAGTLDHPGGWLASKPFVGGDAEPAALLEGFDDPGALRDAALKRHPVGGPAQPAVEALLALVAEVDRADVARVEVAMPGRWEAFRDAAMPALNLPYLCALILVDGHLDVVAAQSLARRHGDDEVAARMATVDIVHDPDQESGPGRERTESARVTLTLTSGRTVERFVGFVPGYPSHPMSGADADAKALRLLTPHLGAARAAEVVACCHDLEHLDRATDLIDLIAR